MLWTRNGVLVSRGGMILSCDRCPCDDEEVGTATVLAGRPLGGPAVGGTGWKSATTWISDGLGSFPWSNPSNADAIDGSYADSQISLLTSPDSSEGLDGTNFSMGIPAGATILGIEMSIHRRRTINSGSPTVVDLNVTLQGLGGGVDNKADTGTNWPAALTEANYGGPSDLWGVSPTVGQLNSTSFGVLVQVEATGASTTDEIVAEIDAVRIKVYYSS